MRDDTTRPTCKEFAYAVGHDQAKAMGIPLTDQPLKEFISERDERRARRKRVTFQFDERSTVNIDTPENKDAFTEIIVRDPATGEERKMYVPKPGRRRPRCGGVVCHHGE